MLKTCPKCRCDKFDFIEYGHDDPEHHDGFSEIQCLKCGARFGRWSEKELQEGEVEKRHGGER